jgi:hypothetical protein
MTGVLGVGAILALLVLIAALVARIRDEDR